MTLHLRKPSGKFILSFNVTLHSTCLKQCSNLSVLCHYDSSESHSAILEHVTRSRLQASVIQVFHKQ